MAAAVGTTVTLTSARRCQDPKSRPGYRLTGVVNGVASMLRLEAALVPEHEVELGGNLIEAHRHNQPARLRHLPSVCSQL